MNELQVFSNADFGELRTIEENGRTWFCGADVARALGYTNPYKALKDHCKDPGVTIRSAGVQTGVKADGSPAIQQVRMKFISEGNVFRLITHSRLPKAEAFEKWVFDEVLPEIHRTGGYGNASNAVKKDYSVKDFAETMKMFPAVFESFAQIYNSMDSGKKKTSGKKKPYHRNRGPKSKIELLPCEIKAEIDFMLKNGETQVKICKFCGSRGFSISQSVMSRYSIKLMKEEYERKKNISEPVSEEEYKGWRQEQLDGQCKFF